jgi:hypothetical protein
VLQRRRLIIVLAAVGCKRLDCVTTRFALFAVPLLEIPSAVKKGDNQNLLGRHTIKQTVVVYENLAQIWVAKFRNHSAAFGKGVKALGCLERTLEHPYCRVSGVVSDVGDDFVEGSPR